MVFVTFIKMKDGCNYSNKQEEIDSLYLTGSLSNPGWYKKEEVFNLIKYNSWIIKVNIAPFPVLVPTISINGEKYVKSVSDNTSKDNLMSLPRA